MLVVVGTVSCKKFSSLSASDMHCHFGKKSTIKQKEAKAAANHRSSHMHGD